VVWRHSDPNETDLGLPLLVVWRHSDPNETDLGLPLPVVWRHSDPNEMDLGLPLLVVWRHTPMKRTWTYHSWWSDATPQWNGPGPATPGGLVPQ